MKLILASKSPRRKELLKIITEDFTVIDTDCDETVNEELSPEEKIAEISRKKAAAALEIAPENSLIISADTAVFLGEKQYGKPKDKDDAQKMLNSFSGKCHAVITAFTVSNGKKSETRVSKTYVYFRNLTQKEIADYVESGEPFDKAGGYGIQGKAGKFINKIDGDYFTVVGLPVCELYEVLKDFGLEF